MSAYNPPKNQPPIFDTSQFQTSEKLDFPIAQGTETFYDIIINGTIIIPATPIAYLNNNQTFTGLNTFSALLTASNGFTLSSGTLTLPANSVSDSALSTNVALRNANNNFTGATNTFNAITLNTNQHLTLQGSGRITQASSTSKNTLNPSEFLGEITFGPSPTARINQTSNGNGALLRQLNMLGNYDIVFDAGTGKIDQSASTGQNIFHTMKFNNALTNKQITLYESSPTNLASNFTISIESTIQRYNVNTGSSHIFSLGTGVSTYTNLATIDTNGLTMNSNKNIVLSGSSIINQSGGTGQNIFNTMKFNNSTTNRQITLFENSPTNVAGNYTLSIETNTLRYNVPTTASHIISIGTGVSTYTNLATIDTNGLTMNSNKNIVFSGTSILSQSGTGDNILKAISMVVDTNLSQSGNGIISQTGTGTNQLKNTTISGTLTLSAGGTLVLPAGSIADSALSSNVPLKNASNTFTNTNTFSTTTIQTNSSVLVLQDSGSPITQTNMNQSGGVLYIQNLNTTGGYEIHRAYNASAVLTELTNLHYTAFGLRSGVPLRVWNTANTDYLEISQSGTTAFITANTSLSTMTLRTNNAGTFVNNIQLSTTNTAINTNVDINNNMNILNGNLLRFYNTGNGVNSRIIQASATQLLLENNYNSSSICLRTKNAVGGSVDYNFAYNEATIPVLLRSFGGISFISGVNQSLIIHDISTFYFYNQTNSGPIIFNVRSSVGNQLNAVDIRHDTTTIDNRLVLNQNTSLPSTQTTQTSGQLGYIHQGTILNIATATTLASGTIYYTASMTLPVGVWNVFAQTCYRFQTGGTIIADNFSISTSSTTISADNLIANTNISGNTGYDIVRRLNGIFSSTGTTSLYITLQVGYTAGPIPQYSNTTQTYTKFYAVRIA